MNKQLTLILSLMAYPLAAMEKPTLEQYLKNKEAEVHSYIGSSVCGVELHIDKKGAKAVAFHSFSCPHAKEFLHAVSQLSNKDDYSILYLKMNKCNDRGHCDLYEKNNISIKQAQTELAAFSASVQARIAKKQEWFKGLNTSEYERTYGSISKQ